MVEMFDPEMIERLKSAERCAVLTGAGISAESGVPTYRDAQTGLWSTTNPEDMDTRAGFLQALSDHAYDLILADYRLPGFNGQALDLQRVARANAILFASCF